MTIAQQLKIKEFPFIINDNNGNRIYYEDSNRHWWKFEYNDKGNEIYREDSDGHWHKREYDDKGNIIYLENSDGHWWKYEYNDNGNEIYRENSDGLIIDNRPKQDKIIEMDGVKYKLVKL
jgi:YD repeat-containing protein